MAVTFILAALLFPFCLGFQLPLGEAEVHDTFKIINVNHDKNGKMNCNSKVTLKNTGKKSYQNRYLYVRLYVNGVPSNAKLPTLNGYSFCSSDHTGIQNIGGLGTNGNIEYTTSRWYEGQELFIDFSDGTFRPGDIICIEVYDKNSNQIISRDTWPEQKKYTTQWFYNHFLNPQSA